MTVYDLRSLLGRVGRFVALVLVSAAALGLRESTAGSAYQASPNLLQNPSFEGDYSAWNWVNEAQVAPGWTPWWRNRTLDDPEAYYFKPEYKKADGYVYANRVHSGAAAQQWFTFYASHQAGMYQQVFGVTPGTRYRFTVWAQVWSSVKDDPSVSNDPSDPRLQVGIDPRGFWNPWGDTIVWSNMYAFYDTWGQLTVEAVAQGDVLTVFMRSEPEWPVKHNDIYWDTAELVAVGQGDAPPPTPTAVPPTAVPPTAALPTATGSETPPPTVAPPTATQAGTPLPTVALPTATRAETPLPTATCAPPPTDWVTYVVQPGDTLAQLATASETTVQAIVSANCIHNVNIIEVGQELLLPASSSLPTPAGPTPTATAAASATPTRSIASPTAEPPTSIPSPVATITPWSTLTPVPTSTPTPALAPTPLPSATVAAPTVAYPATDLANVSGARLGRFAILVTCMVLVLMLGFMLGKRSRS